MDAITTTYVPTLKLKKKKLGGVTAKKGPTSPTSPPTPGATSPNGKDRPAMPSVSLNWPKRHLPTSFTLKVSCQTTMCDNFRAFIQYNTEMLLNCIPDAKRGYYGFIIVVVRALVRALVRRDFLLATYSPHFFPDFFHIWQVA